MFRLSPYCLQRGRKWPNHGATSSDCRNTPAVKFTWIKAGRKYAFRSIWSHLNTETPIHIPRQHISIDCFIAAKLWRFKYGTDYKILVPKNLIFISKETAYETAKKARVHMFYYGCIWILQTNINNDIFYNLILHSDLWHLHTDWAVCYPFKLTSSSWWFWDVAITADRD